jgi:hypothetical protein
MHNQKEWIAGRVRLGWAVLTLGGVVLLAGIITEIFTRQAGLDTRSLTAVGILLVGVGAGLLGAYRGALRGDSQAVRRVIEERDERSLQIRHRAGYRGFWTAMVVVYAGLMWASSASWSGLPELSGDLLWYFLAGCVLIPFAVYTLSSLIDQRSS